MAICVREWALMFGIIDAAKTKPYGFMAFIRPDSDTAYLRSFYLS